MTKEFFDKRSNGLSKIIKKSTFEKLSMHMGLKEDSTEK